MKRISFLFVTVASLLAACGPTGFSTPIRQSSAPAVQPPTATDVPVDEPAPPAALTLSSPAFANEADIPIQYGEAPFKTLVEGNNYFICTNSAESTNRSPALEWKNVPADAQSLVMLMWDQMNYAYPDAPASATFAHWVVFNIPPTAVGLAEGASAELTLPEGALQGSNNYPAPFDSGYGGPCPGAEKHLYVFTLYALDSMLDLPTGTDQQTVQAVIVGHILTQAELKGYFTGQ